MAGPQNSERRPQNSSSSSPRKRESAWKLLENKIPKLNKYQIKTTAIRENTNASNTNLSYHRACQSGRGGAEASGAGPGREQRRGRALRAPREGSTPPPTPPRWVGLSVVTLAYRPGEAEAPLPGARRRARRCSGSAGWSARGQLSGPRRPSRLLATRSPELRPRPLRAGPWAQVRGLGWAGLRTQFGESRLTPGCEACKG